MEVRRDRPHRPPPAPRAGDIERSCGPDGGWCAHHARREHRRSVHSNCGSKSQRSDHYELWPARTGPSATLTARRLPGHKDLISSGRPISSLRVAATVRLARRPRSSCIRCFLPTRTAYPVRRPRRPQAEAEAPDSGPDGAAMVPSRIPRILRHATVGQYRWFRWLRPRNASLGSEGSACV